MNPYTYGTLSYHGEKYTHMSVLDYYFVYKMRKQHQFLFTFLILKCYYCE